VAFQGLPARICWLGYGEPTGRSRVQRPVESGELSADRIGRDHLEVVRSRSPLSETESMLRLRRHRRLAAAQRPG